MPRRAIIRTMLATVLGLSVLLPAAPAAADNTCCQVGISALPARFAAGAPPQFFVMTMANNSQQSITGQVQAIFAFHANNLNGGQIHIQRKTIAGWRNLDIHNRNGSPEATDTFSFFFPQVFGGGTRIDSQYRLSFTSKAPSTSVAITVTLTGRTDGHGGGGNRQQLAQGGPYQTSIVSATVAQPSPTGPTAQPTPSQSLNTAEPTPSDVTDMPTDDGTTIGLTGSDSGGGDSGFTWLMYTIGALLLLGGIGVIGTMLWRRGPQPVETDWREPGEYGSHAAPSGRTFPSHRVSPSNAAPTTVYGSPPATYDAPTQYDTPTLGAPPQPYGPRIDPTTRMPRQ